MRNSQMPVKSLVRYANQIAIKARLFNPCFIPTYQQNCFPFQVEGIGHTPCSAIRIEPQFFHFGVT